MKRQVRTINVRSLTGPIPVRLLGTFTRVIDGKPFEFALHVTVGGYGEALSHVASGKKLVDIPRGTDDRRAWCEAYLDEVVGRVGEQCMAQTLIESAEAWKV